jgi:ubiquinone/menaquinone biosynthesis C-methylase UbiE
VDPREQFGRQASFYSTSAVHATGAGDLIELLDPPASGVALDIGTGAGHTAHALARRCRYVLASDITPEMLAETRRLGASLDIRNLQAVFSLAERLPFAEGSLYAVTCRLAAHHFRDPAAFCAEAARVLKPGGRFLIHDTIAPEDDEVAAWVNDIEIRRDHSHVEDYKASRWRELVETAGLNVVAFEVLTDASHHELYEWTERAATPAEDVAYIKQGLEQAPESVVKALSLKREGDTFRWSWHVLTIVAQKQA